MITGQNKITAFRCLAMTVLVLVICCPTSHASGLSYADNLVFSYGYIDFAQAGPLALTEYPFASPGSKMSFQTSYQSLYGLSELSDNRAAGAVRWGRFICGGGLSVFGKADYFQQLGLSAFTSYHTGSYAVGASLIYSRISFGRNYGYLSAYTANLGFAYSYRKLQGYGVARTINQPKYYESAQPLAPEFEIGLTYKTGDGLDNQIKALFIRDQKPTAAVMQSFDLNKYASINWSLVLRPARFVGGLSLEKGHFGFDYRFSHHPVLGATHTVMLVVFK